SFRAALSGRRAGSDPGSLRTARGAADPAPARRHTGLRDRRADRDGPGDPSDRPARIARPPDHRSGARREFRVARFPRLCRRRGDRAGSRSKRVAEAIWLGATRESRTMTLRRARHEFWGDGPAYRAIGGFTYHRLAAT